VLVLAPTLQTVALKVTVFPLTVALKLEIISS